MEVAFDQYSILNINDIRFYLASRQARNQELKLIIAEGYRNPLALSTDVKGVLCTDLNCYNAYEVNVRAMAYKIPGMLMTGYDIAEFFSMNMVSELQYKQMIDDFFRYREPHHVAVYDELQADYNFTNGVPKFALGIKL